MSDGVRSGRRPGPGGSREDILSAARAAFANHGYAGASVRAIARDAGVDQSLVHHFFGTKEKLLLAAVAFPVDPAVAFAPLLVADPDLLGRRIADFYVGLFEHPATRAPAIALLQSSMTNDQAARLLRTFVTEQIVARLRTAIHLADADLRATLVGSQLVGMAVVRYVVRIEPLASAAPEVVANALAPTLQRYLTGRL